MKIYRFSEDGFTPARQDIVINMLEFYLDPFNDEKLLAANLLVDMDRADWVKENLLRCKEFADTRYNDFISGVWVFVGDICHIDERYIKSQLNHLDETTKEKRSWWSAEISHEIEAYYASCKLYKHHLYEMVGDAVYIPAFNLNLLTDINPIDSPF